MTHVPMDNGEYMMRAQREAQRAAQMNPYNPSTGPFGPYPPGMWGPEPPAPEDTTGLKMLDEFLAKRKGERDGDDPERK